VNFNNDQIKDLIEKHWNWAINNVQKILAVNSMCNILILDSNNRTWRICPEELSATIEAKSTDELNALFNDVKYKKDWQFLGLIDEAENILGVLKDEECYALKIPAVLGGEYSIENTIITNIEKYLKFSGNAAFQIKDLADGEYVHIEYSD
jgi:hypothetical protein